MQTDNNKQERKQCGRCKVNLKIEDFRLKRCGNYTARCIQCNITMVQKSKCIHNKRKSTCKECGGSSICEHKRIKSQCKDCCGGSICEHNKRKSACKDCGGSQICEHKRVKSRCKDCGGSQICEHKREKAACKDCGGSQICEHKRQKSQCKDCGGGSICEHNKRKSACKDCGGSQICIHSRQKSQCKDCGGGSICEHNREKSRCRDCRGSQICIHTRQKSTCKDCDPAGHLQCVVRGRINCALKSNKNKSSIEYLGCTIDEFKEHIEKQFTGGMTWDNHGNGTNGWHIDYICPIKYAENGVAPKLEDIIKRLHWKNTQPMRATENISKGNRFIGK
jgi:hypothetical protein